MQRQTKIVNIEEINQRKPNSLEENRAGLTNEIFKNRLTDWKKIREK